VDLLGPGDQRAKDHRSGARIIKRRMGRRHVEPKLLDQPGQAWGLAFGQLEHEPGQRRGVDDRMLQRAFEPSTDEPRVECVMAVLDEDGALRKPQECAPRIAELRRTDQHRAVDVVPLLRVGVDRSAAIDERVEERQRAGKLEPFGPQLEHEERRVARRLDVDGDELRVVEQRLRAELWRVDRDLLPWDGLGGPARLEEDRLHD
jgi:hypothetical protein